MRRFCAGLPLPLLLRAKSGWAKPLLPYIQPKQPITDCPSNPMHQGMCHRHHAPTIQTSCSHLHHSCSPHPQPSFLHFPLLVTFHICLFVSERGSRDIKTAVQISPPLSSPSNTLSHPHPPQPFSSFNLLLTTWRGIASSSPPLLHPELPHLNHQTWD